MTDLDRLIHALYAAAVQDEWTVFRVRALGMLCAALGADSAAWLTGSGGAAVGEFSQYPQHAGLSAEQLAPLCAVPGGRERIYRPLPPGLGLDAGTDETGYVFHYMHRGGGPGSLVLLRHRHDPGQRPGQTGDWQRAIGHMVEAGSVALSQFIQRDDWLHALGRPSRGAAALVDRNGLIYAASPRFRKLIATEFDLPETFARLPATLPASILDHGGDLRLAELRCRVTRHRQLYQIHARRLAALDVLTPREQQIARALSTGKTFKGVAREHDLAVSTVANHVSRIYKKLGIFRREELIQLLRSP